jgi:hypothetical protein
MGAHEQGSDRTELGWSSVTWAAVRRSSGTWAAANDRAQGRGLGQPLCAPTAVNASHSRRSGNAPERPATAVDSWEPTEEGGSCQFGSATGEAVGD